MVYHHPETLLERSTMVARGLSLLQIKGHHSIQIEQGEMTLMCFLHHPDAPIDIGGEPVLKVIGERTGKVSARIECLMAHEHTTHKGAPSEVAWSREVAVSHKASLVVHHICLTIEHGRPLATVVTLTLGSGSYRGEGIGRGETVARIQKEHIVARGSCQALVHGIIKTSVGFGKQTDGAHRAGFTCLLFLLVGLGKLQGSVR